tara:strand:- start:429 stop:599 length:171 start_codon:yes stop_codon:yes gene_type:complete
MEEEEKKVSIHATVREKTKSDLDDYVKKNTTIMNKIKIHGFIDVAIEEYLQKMKQK